SYTVDTDTTLTFEYAGHATGVIPLGGEKQGGIEPDCSSPANWWLCLLDVSGVHYPSAVFNRYGRGGVKMLTFGPEAIVDVDIADLVMADVIEDVKAAVPSLPHVPIPGGLTITRGGEVLPLFVTISAPPGALLLPYGASEVLDERTARWLLEDMQAQSRVRYRLMAREPGSYDIGVEVVDVHGEAILHSGYYYYQISKSDHEVISELINAMRQQVRTRALPLALMLSK